jgi:hypothetical protein
MVGSFFFVVIFVALLSLYAPFAAMIFFPATPQNDKCRKKGFSTKYPEK